MDPFTDPDVCRALAGLYDEYNNDVAPLIILAEARTQRFNISILNEVRAFNDHVARVYQEKTGPQEALTEIEGARRHSWRIMLDSYKVLCLHGAEVVEQFWKDYKDTRLGEVDSGKFLPILTALHGTAADLTETAKLLERAGATDKEKTLSAFREAFLAHTEVRKHIRSNLESLQWSMNQQRKKRFGERISNVVIAGIVSFLMGCLSTWLIGKYVTTEGGSGAPAVEQPTVGDKSFGPTQDDSKATVPGR